MHLQLFLDEVKFDENLYYFREKILTQKGCMKRQHSAEDCSLWGQARWPQHQLSPVRQHTDYSCWQQRNAKQTCNERDRCDLS